MDPHRQLYCSRCKNWILTSPQGLDFFVNIRTMLDEHHWFAPFIEINTSEKLPWAVTGAEHSFATQPDLEGFTPQIEAFARVDKSPG